MFPRHPSLKFKSAKKFVEEDEPLPEAEEAAREEMELRAIPRPIVQLPTLPEPALSWCSVA